jgi:hypothetical protein
MSPYLPLSPPGEGLDEGSAGVRHMMGGDRDHDDWDRQIRLPMSRADSKADVSPFST